MEVDDIVIKEEEDDEDLKPEVKDEVDDDVVPQKKSKPGIIYLATVPPKMNVTQIREYFSAFGVVNRSFLQPDTSEIIIYYSNLNILHNLSQLVMNMD